jgi:pyrroline-5-carboxylate reductase
MTLGFVGTGTISAAVVHGLQSASWDANIVVSPRNAEIARGLAERYPKVRVASGNQRVVDDCGTVILAIRPQIAHEVITSLKFRPDHHIISLIPAVSLKYLQSVTAPSAEVTRAVPLPSASYRQGPTVLYPPTPAVKELFDQVGTAIPLESEDEFDAFTTATATLSSYFGFAETIASWLVQQGISYDKAHIYVGQMLRGLSAATVAMPDLSFDKLAEEHQTHGGLNEQVYNAITTGRKFVELQRAMDGVLQRLIAGKAGK